MNLHEWKDILLSFIVGCSVAHTFLPPWDAPPFQPFPTFQKYYRVLIYVVGYLGINARSTVYPSISINNPTGVNNQGKEL
jgi:hypothetical protein